MPSDSGVTVCTGMWGAKQRYYADTFLPSFDANWPEEVKLVVVTDPLLALHGLAPSHDCTQIALRGSCGWDAFMHRHGQNPERWGKAVKPSWKPRARAAGYNFRFDACRFAGQAFAPELAAAHLPDGEVLVWLDADVVAHQRVPAGFVEGLVGDADGAFLGRAPKHSEIGFWAVRLNMETRVFLTAFAELYRSDRLFSLKEWHSAFAWDDARRWAESHGLIAMRDLTPGGHGHVWFDSPLAAHLDHLKGEARKARGASPERSRAR